MVHNNKETDHTILLLLYQHRALSVEQVYKLGFFNMLINSLRNRLRTLVERKVLNVNSRSSIKKVPIHMYSLSHFGLRIVVDDVLKVREYIPRIDEFKEHYTLNDLRVRGYHDHYLELQEWLCTFLTLQPDRLHCEWRRFPLFDDETIPYLPDWLLFDRSEKLEAELKEDLSHNTLLYPYFFRKTCFDDESLAPLFSIECDRGTIGRAELVDKWELYRKAAGQYRFLSRIIRESQLCSLLFH
ncbi:replication-relaxation family protein [Bacillus sp. SCS-151]|uniref:replication-relaxation family protein n=1 Tax=Nanhaiella sioensis TaxID=3115293 RepID=UPI00397CE4F6